MKSDTGPFAIIPEWVLFHPKLKAQSIRLYAVLASHADRKKLDCWPSRATLAKEANCSLDTIDRAVKELANEGAIVCTPRKDERGNTSNHYLVKRVIPETLPIPSRTDAAPPSRAGAAQNQNQVEPESSEPPSQSEIDSSSPPQAAFRTTVTAFYEAPGNRKVGALIDMAASLGIPRSGHAAALIKEYGGGREIVRALQEAASQSVGDPWEYMRKVLGNGQESQFRNRGLDTDRGSGNSRQPVAQGASEILTEEEARRILAARADAGGGGGPGPEAIPED